MTGFLDFFRDFLKLPEGLGGRLFVWILR
jgi:hypothetical protein